MMCARYKISIHSVMLANDACNMYVNWLHFPPILDAARAGVCVCEACMKGARKRKSKALELLKNSIILQFKPFSIFSSVRFVFSSFFLSPLPLLLFPFSCCAHIRSLPMFTCFKISTYIPVIYAIVSIDGDDDDDIFVMANRSVCAAERRSQARSQFLRFSILDSSSLSFASWLRLHFVTFDTSCMFSTLFVACILIDNAIFLITMNGCSAVVLPERKRKRME